MTRTTPLTARMLVPALLLGLCGSAHAQNALGDGRALDNNLEVGSGRVNRVRPTIQDDLNFRNAIVTGNVGGGREFRGGTGYTASDDFRGQLGSEDLFRFRADTAFNSGSFYSGYSGLATNNLRGLGAIQMQLDLPVLGQTQGLAGNLIINREGAGYTGAQVTQGVAPNSRVDPFSSITRSLRSTSAYIIDNAIQPEVVATMGSAAPVDPNAPASPFSESYQMLLTASELHGVRPLSESSPAIGRARPMPVNPAAPAGTMPPTGVGAESTGVEEAPRTTGERVSAESVSPKLEPRVGTYEAAMEELRVRAEKFELTSGSASPAVPEEPEEAPEEPALVEEANRHRDFDGLMKALDDLRDIMTNAPETEETDPAKLLNPDNIGDPRQPQEPANSEPPATRLEMVQRAQKMLAEQDITINTLTPTQSTNEIFTDHMQLGEKAMGEGRWFDAEERFTAAIAIRQGDAMAAAGRVNSQLAAGMYLSSALNLRNLLRAYPEVIGVRFSENLLPRGDRLEKVRTQLRGRSQLDSDMARDAGFLLAYLGHQTGSQKDITDGFAVIDRVNAAQKVDADVLTQTCRAVWVKAK